MIIIRSKNNRKWATFILNGKYVKMQKESIMELILLMDGGMLIDINSN